MIINSEEDTSIDDCESPYSASKASGEAFVSSYHNCYSLDSVILRFSNVYGRFDASNRIIPLFIAQAENDIDLTVYGASKVLDFTYIDDCVDGILRCLKNFEIVSGTTLNIASGKGTSLVRLAGIISKMIGSSSSTVIEENRTGEVNRYISDNSKAKKLIGYQPNYSIERGLESTYEWYRNNDHLYDEILD